MKTSRLSSLQLRKKTYSTRIPPIIRTIDNRIPRRLRMIRVHEILDPGDHGGRAEAVARRAVRVVLDVEHAGQGDAVTGPAAAVGEEVVGLRGAAAGVRVGEVVAAADETGGGGAVVVGGEGGVDVVGAFCCLGGERGCVRFGSFFFLWKMFMGEVKGFLFSPNSG